MEDIYTNQDIVNAIENLEIAITKAKDEIVKAIHENTRTIEQLGLDLS